MDLRAMTLDEITKELNFNREEKGPRTLQSEAVWLMRGTSWRLRTTERESGRKEDVVH